MSNTTKFYEWLYSLSVEDRRDFSDCSVLEAGEKAYNAALQTKEPEHSREVPTNNKGINGAREIFDRLYRRWRTSLDPVVIFRTEEFEEKEECIIKDTEDVRNLLNELEYFFYQEECAENTKLNKGEI